MKRRVHFFPASKFLIQENCLASKRDLKEIGKGKKSKSCSRGRRLSANRGNKYNSNVFWDFCGRSNRMQILIQVSLHFPGIDRSDETLKISLFHFFLLSWRVSAENEKNRTNEINNNRRRHRKRVSPNSNRTNNCLDSASKTESRPYRSFFLRGIWFFFFCCCCCLCLGWGRSSQPPHCSNRLERVHG